jgi:alkylation response protein AidB-like acyl-CoA dehydrogenase
MKRAWGIRPPRVAFLLARTNVAARKQEGISFLLADMTTPGITVRPIQTIDGSFDVNEVFFDDVVVVPVENLVGDENKGWDYAKFLLGNERTGIARIGISKARLRRIRELAAVEPAGDRPLIEDAGFRRRLAAVEIEVKALEMTQLRVVAEERGRGTPNPASSIFKLRGSQIQQAFTELLMDVVGPWALMQQPAGECHNESLIGPDAAEAAPAYFNMHKVSISTAARTRFSAASSPRRSWDSSDMDFDLSDDQRLLRDTVERLVADRYGFDQRRHYAREPDG